MKKSENEHKTFDIGGFVFNISCPKKLSFPDNFLLFETKDFSALDCEAAFSYHIELSEDLSLPKEKPYAEREDMKIYRDGALESRLIGARGHDGYYAFYREISENECVITLNASQSELLCLDTVFTSLFAFERRFLTRDALILHCAYIEYNGEAILFSAASGTGKSTQGHLWEKYRNARTINGDRGLLTLKDSKWHANGWPVCGSSEICSNISLSIRAIVMLSQAPENSVYKMSPKEAFTSLYSQLTINNWERSATVRSMDILEKLIFSVPIYHLACNISEDAVNTLYNALYGEEAV